MSKFQLFLIALDDARADDEEMAAWLDVEERSRWAAFERPGPRRRFLVAHAALRLILSRIMGRDPAQIEFCRNAWGRPETKAGPSFNMSHSGASALIAIAEKGAVGVDIEAADRNVSPEVFAAVASDIELDVDIGHRFDARDRLQFWVRKEAVLKALGRGLSFSPRALTVGAHAPEASRWRPAELSGFDGARRFSFVDLALPFRLLGALAVDAAEGDARRIDIEQLTF